MALVLQVYLKGFLLTRLFRGVQYTCGSISGVTGANGEFEYTSDCQIELRVGNIILGTVSSDMIRDNRLYPSDLARVSRSNITDEKVRFMIRFLQSLDSNNNPSDGIQIDTATTEKFSNIDKVTFTGNSADELTENDIGTMLTNEGFTLISEEAALNHYRDTLKDDLGITPTEENTPDPTVYLSTTINETANPGDELIKIPATTLSILEGEISSISVTGVGYDNFSTSNDGTITLSEIADLNYNIKNIYNLEVVVTDTYQKSLVAQLEVAVEKYTNSENPILITNETSISVDENQIQLLTIESKGGTPELTYSLSGIDSSYFKINSNIGLVSFITAPDYETKNSYLISLVVTDSLNNTASKEITVTINDIDDTAPVISNDTSISVDENQTSALTINASDENTITYGIDGTDKEYFNVDSSTGVVTFINAPDYEGKRAYSIVLVTKDSFNNKSALNVTININDLDDTPPKLLNASTISVDENQTSALTISASDVNTITYDIDGIDKGYFNVNSSTGVVTFINAPDYESQKQSYTITIKAADSLNNSSSREITITINDVDDTAPTISNASTISVDENQTSALTISASDVNTITYDIDGIDKGYFNVNSSTGVVTFINAPDYESQKQSYTITIKAADSLNNSSSREITITINDVDDTAPTISNASTISVDENQTTLLTISANDENTITYDIDGTDKEYFNVNSSTGVVTFINAPDYETKPSYTILLVATDSLDNSSSKEVTITINDIYEATANPLIVSKVTALDGAFDDRFGRSIDMDGDYIVVGAPYDDDNGSNSGSAYIYKKQGDGSVVQLAKLLPDDGSASYSFGSSVAINGNYIVVGSPFADENNLNNSGSVYIFENNGLDSFSQLQKITITNTTSYASFGVSVDIEGDYVVAGASGDDEKGSYSGAAYVFKLQGGIFSEVQKLLASDGQTSNYFGNAVSINKDYIVIGSSRDSNGGGSSVGSVYIFKNNGQDIFNELQKLSPDEKIDYGYFGKSVDMDGDYIAVGTSTNNESNNTAGLAYLFKKDSSDTFTQVAKLTALDGESYDYFGDSVSINGDYVTVSAYSDDNTYYDSGSIYIFKNDGSDSFSQLSKIVAPTETEYGSFGYSISMAGKYLAVGASGEQNYTGSFYLVDIFAEEKPYILNFKSNYDVNEDATSVTTFSANSNIGSTFTYTISGVDSQYFDIGINSGVLSFKTVPDFENPSDAGSDNIYNIDINVADSLNNSNSYSLTVTVKNILITHTSKIFSPDPANADYFGLSVANNDQYIVIGSSTDDKLVDINTSVFNSGAAYVYKSDGTFVTKLTDSSNQATNYFGSAVGIWGDYIAIGASKNNEVALEAGAVYIFKNIGDDTFQEVSKITASDGQARDGFGSTISMYGDYIAIGAIYDDEGNSTNNGSVYIYKNNGLDEYSFVTKVFEETPSQDVNFGRSISLSQDHLAVGTNENKAFLYQYTYDGETGSSQNINTFFASDSAVTSGFGYSISMYENYIAIGSIKDTDKGINSGAVYIYNINGGEVSQITKLTASDGQANDNFGSSLSFYGVNLVIGSLGSDGGNGSVYLFRNNLVDSFTQAQKLTVNSTSGSDDFGKAISLYKENIVIGAPDDNTNGNSSGSAYLYSIDSNEVIGVN